MCALFSSLFFGKKELWPGMTDVHTHLLPGVDDGFSSLDDSREMLTFLEERGVERIFLTPHIMADLTKNRAVSLKERFGAFRESCAQIHVDMRLAAEYMLDECFYERMEEGLLSYDGQHVLVEVSCLQAPGDLFEKLYDMQLNGYIPVMAHPERYGFWNINELLKLKEHGCKFQLNIFSLMGFYGPLSHKTAVSLLKNSHYDFVGSDIHSLNYRRSYNSLQLKKDQYGEVEKLVHGNDGLWR
ncbi:hypothetical protein DXD68_18860 [Parabacteroides sp. TM07-1AC]|jgi:tyrosine-protein phosphatase YwqE|uniref:tyrosine-protein phosphatase n=1 Tax=Parabacteroides sp. TM07-1AC TaxID=2292363 RepID=UPI000EFE6E74|nr:CpsB/CapC family capsule biosynthesis tyrosine phosphatase [Parabacteroides sp. TM07-1AC]RHU23728.1 hypothetical protein DXD68_18860 [Parabacteroides sp. TM07-1AC]